MRTMRWSMAKACGWIVVAVVMGAALGEASAANPTFGSVSEVQNAHDRALIRDLKAYADAHPKADDVDQAYMAILNKTIEHDWFLEYEAIAARYLTDHPEGPVQSLARIVTTMARAQDGKFDEALARYEELMRTLGKPEQLDFATNFTDSLAGAAMTAGEYRVAVRVLETLLDRYSDSPDVRQKVRGELARLEKIGKPVPSVAVRDVKGDLFRFEDLKGKYVLVDFWATWCAPCVAELPRVQAAYAKYHAAGFEVVGVSLDETKDALTDYTRSRNIPWRQLHNGSSGGDLVEAFGVGTIPATYLIDPTGKLIRLDLRGVALDQALARIFAGASRAQTSR